MTDAHGMFQKLVAQKRIIERDGWWMARPMLREYEMFKLPSQRRSYGLLNQFRQDIRQPMSLLMWFIGLVGTAYGVATQDTESLSTGVFFLLAIVILALRMAWIVRRVEVVSARIVRVSPHRSSNRKFCGDAVEVEVSYQAEVSATTSKVPIPAAIFDGLDLSYSAVDALVVNYGHKVPPECIGLAGVD